MDSTINHHQVSISMSRGGRGRPLVFCPGLGMTQSDLRELIGLLRRDHDVVSFDLSGHGASTPAESYSFDTFLTDLAAVMAELDRTSFGRPMLVGFSLGADLALRYVAEHPESVAELVLIDGANPLPEPFLTETELPWFRAMKEQELTTGAVSLSADDIVAVSLELETVRADILEAYRVLDIPITMIMSTAIAGEGNDWGAPRLNRLWRSGVERLIRERPDIAVSWMDGDHGSVVTQAQRISDLVSSTRVGR